MPSLAVSKAGSIGLVKDREDHTLPPEAWSELKNMRCVDKSIKAFSGHTELASITGAPQTLTAVRSGLQTYFVYADDTQIHSFSAGTETDISGYGYTSAGRWDSTILGGVAVLNNGYDNPQYWGGAGLAQDLPYDSTDESNTCYWKDIPMTARLIRSFKYHLFAMDITEPCMGRNRRRVWWSHPAEPGTVPITWDINNADFDARDTELTETSGYILDALQLKDSLQIYLTDAIYSVTFTGRQDRQVFNFRNVTTSKGIYSRNCVCDVGGKHFLVSDGDIYLYDGTNFISIADERVKETFFDNVNRTTYDKVFCAFYHKTQEVWLCYPEAGNLDCNKALVFNVEDNTWSQRDIPDSRCAVFAVVDRSSSYTWATLPYATWGDWGTTPAVPQWTRWGEPLETAPIFDSLILGGDEKLWEMDSGNQANGSNLECYARRTGVDLGDKADWHMVTTVYPKASGDAFQVRLGTLNILDGSYSWGSYQTFTPGTDYKLNFRTTGRLHAIEFYSNADVSWTLEGFEVDFAPVGRR